MAQSGPQRCNNESSPGLDRPIIQPEPSKVVHFRQRADHRSRSSGQLHPTWRFVCRQQSDPDPYQRIVPRLFNSRQRSRFELLSSGSDRIECLPRCLPNAFLKFRWNNVFDFPFFLLLIVQVILAKRNYRCKGITWPDSNHPSSRNYWLKCFKAAVLSILPTVISLDINFILSDGPYWNSLYHAWKYWYADSILCDCHLAWIIRDNRRLLASVRNGMCSNETTFEDLDPSGFTDCLAWIIFQTCLKYCITKITSCRSVSLFVVFTQSCTYRFPRGNRQKSSTTCWSRGIARYPPAEV